MSEIDIGTLRFETERQLDELTQRRGAHLLDDEPFDDAEVEKLQRKLNGLTAAVGEQARRQRADAATERTERRILLADELMALEVRRLDAIADTEKATRQLVAGLTKIKDVSSAMRKTCLKGDFGIPISLDDFGTASRISTYMGAVFTKLAGPGTRYGSLRWHYSGFHKAAVDFSAQEEKLLFSQLNESTRDIKHGNHSSS